MCGIAGIVAAVGPQRAPGADVVRRMAATLTHRGPDASGCWTDGTAALGHTRLSIIDLSPAGRQPMQDESGRYVMVYNGEVYNYRELRSQLEDRGYRFRSTSDSEVVLTAYREWGPSALDRFNGMWAFAIWDAERGELFAARDRAGKKPFYYASDATGAFYFASEVKALRAAGLQFGLNPQAAFDFLAQGTYGHLGEQGFFLGVNQLPAGHRLRLRPGGRAHVERYWDLPVVRGRDRLPYDAEFRRRFRELLIDAVRLRLRADVPVGATLSGGLDSSALVLIANELTGGRPMHLFTSLYPGSGYDETPYFQAVTSRLGRPLVHHATPSAERWRDDLLCVLDHQEEPFGDTSIFAHFALMRAARAAGVPVLLSGQGGDEVLLGYPSLVTAYLGSRLARGHIIHALTEAWRWSRGTPLGPARAVRNMVGAALPLPARDRLRRRYAERMAAGLTSALRARSSLRRFGDEACRDALDSYLAQTFKRFTIPHLTHYDDRNAMAFSVEGRMPFLDYRVIELLFAARYDALFHGGLTKRVLREAFADLLPDAVRQRRDKIGFYTPLAAWLRASAAWVAQFMTRERMEHVGVLEPTRYLSCLRELALGSNAPELEVWRGLIFHLWVERFGVAPLAAEAR